MDLVSHLKSLFLSNPVLIKAAVILGGRIENAKSTHSFLAALDLRQISIKMGIVKSITAWLLAVSAGLAFAAPSPLPFKIDKRYVEVRDDIKYNVFEHAATGAKLSFVNNSGICETTPGVNQYSGYLTVGTNMNMWFWYETLRIMPVAVSINSYAQVL